MPLVPPVSGSLKALPVPMPPSRDADSSEEEEAERAEPLAAAPVERELLATEAALGNSEPWERAQLEEGSAADQPAEGSQLSAAGEGDRGAAWRGSASAADVGREARGEPEGGELSAAAEAERAAVERGRVLACMPWLEGATAASSSGAGPSEGGWEAGSGPHEAPEEEAIELAATAEGGRRASGLRGAGEEVAIASSAEVAPVVDERDAALRVLADAKVTLEGEMSRVSRELVASRRETHHYNSKAVSLEAIAAYTARERDALRRELVRVVGQRDAANRALAAAAAGHLPWESVSHWQAQAAVAASYQWQDALESLQRKLSETKGQRDEALQELEALRREAMGHRDADQELTVTRAALNGALTRARRSAEQRDAGERALRQNLGAALREAEGHAAAAASLRSDAARLAGELAAARAAGEAEAARLADAAAVEAVRRETSDAVKSLWAELAQATVEREEAQRDLTAARGDAAVLAACSVDDLRALSQVNNTAGAAIRDALLHALVAAQVRAGSGPGSSGNGLCPVCEDEARPRDTRLAPCGHVFCGACAGSVRDCPMCRAPVQRRERVFL